VESYTLPGTCVHIHKHNHNYTHAIHSCVMLPGRDSPQAEAINYFIGIFPT
jgi:hypothetical protein